jgi:hypothetical protein
VSDRPTRLTREQQYAIDIQAMMNDPRFRRFALRLLDASGMFRSSYGDDSRNLSWWEGRRSLGLDILGLLQGVDRDALLALAAEEQKTRMENPSGRRNDSDRRDELGTGAGRDPDGRDRDVGAGWLDYGTAPS